MIIGLLGDLHGRGSWLGFALRQFKNREISTIVQLGDFGLWPKKSAFVDSAQKKLTEYGQTLYVIPGNHEDYDQIDNIPVHEDGFQHLRDNILLAPRGHRWNWDSASFVALGGAPSVDRSHRKSSGSDKSWWAQEAITPEDVAKTIAGGYADVMLAHDAPEGLEEIHRQVSHNPHGFLEEDLLYAADGRRRMEEAVQGVRPKLFFHGHYHFLVNEKKKLTNGQESHIVGFARDHLDNSLGSLDTETLVPSVFPEMEAAYYSHKMWSVLEGEHFHVRRASVH